MLSAIDDFDRLIAGHFSDNEANLAKIDRENENILSDEPDHMHSLSFSSTTRHNPQHYRQQQVNFNAHRMLQCDVPFYSVLDEQQGGEARWYAGAADDVDEDDERRFAPFDTSDDLLGGAYDASPPAFGAAAAAPEVCGSSSTPSLFDAGATLHPSISHVLSQSIQNIADSSSCIIDDNSRGIFGGRAESQQNRRSSARCCTACMLRDESELQLFDAPGASCKALERGNNHGDARCAAIGQTRRRAHTLGAIGSSPSHNIPAALDTENQRSDLTKSRQKPQLSHHKYPSSSSSSSSSFHAQSQSFRGSVPNYYESPHRTYETPSANCCSSTSKSDQSKSKCCRHHHHHNHSHNHSQHHQSNRNNSKKYAAINCDTSPKQHNQVYQQQQRSESNCGASSRKNSQMSSANAGGNSTNGSNSGNGGGGGQKLYSFCTFCKNNGESEAIYGTHYLKDVGGLVTCPILRAYTCPICGQSGDRAHTVKYCPFMSQLAAAAAASSEPKKMSSSNAEGQRACGSHNNQNTANANANKALTADSAALLNAAGLEHWQREKFGAAGSGVALSMPFRSEMRVLRTARTSAGKRRFL